MTNVQNYTDTQILRRVKSLNTYSSIPTGYWFCFVRSSEDANNVFDDKVYMYKGETFIGVTSCTTNSGDYGLKNFFKWNKKGVAIVKADMWYYNTWKRDKHRGKMEAWRQILAKIAVYRDGDKDSKAEELGKIYWGYFGINIHTVTYGVKNIVKRFINGWSTGCFVMNVTKKYREFLGLVDEVEQKEMSSCLLNEWDPR